MDERNPRADLAEAVERHTPVRVIVNGTAAECPPGLSVAELIYHLGLPAERVAVERNREIVKRDQRDSVAVLAGDVFEIVTFVGGG